MARKLINTKEISHEQWLTLRKKSIGGSDAGALMDMNPYQSPVSLYADKKGLSKDKETNEAMRLGNDLEDYVAHRWMEKSGKKVRADNFMYQHDDYDFITANIDRDVVGENAGLECKTMSGFAKYDLEDGEVPAQYYAQCQHYMMVKGYDKMYLAILVFQRGIYCLEVERNEEFIKELLAAEIDFWTNYIEKDQMPPPDGSDAASKRRCRDQKILRAWKSYKGYRGRKEENTGAALRKARRYRRGNRRRVCVLMEISGEDKR